MARAHGRNGQIYVGIASSSAAASPLPNVKKWSLNATTQRSDGTSFGDTNKVYVAGLPDGSGSFEGFWDSGTAQTWTAASDGQARNFYLYPSTPAAAGPYWYGTAFFDFTIDTDVEGIVAFKGTFTPASSITKVGN